MYINCFHTTGLSTPPIAFLVELGKDLVNPAAGAHVVFDVIHLNDGGAYNNVHGVFTAPVAGVYHFTLELSFPNSNVSHGIYVYLMKTSTEIGYIYFDGTANRWLKHSTTATIHLAKGDDIWAKVIGRSGDSKIGGCCYHSIFSGFLIRAD